MIGVLCLQKLFRGGRAVPRLRFKVIDVMGFRLLVDQSLVGIAYALEKCVNLVSQVSLDILFKETIGLIFLDQAVVGFSYLLPDPVSLTPSRTTSPCSIIQV